jgi:hypothetical protein
LAAGAAPGSAVWAKAAVQKEKARVRERKRRIGARRALPVQERLALPVQAAAF